MTGCAGRWRDGCWATAGAIPGALWAAPEPDLRETHHHFGAPGDQLVRLELAVPVAEVLCFDFHAWHRPLAGHYLSVYHEEDDAWDTLPAHARTREAVEASWERHFDPSAPLDSWYGPLETIQAAFETLRLADVTGVTPFRARIAVRNLPRLALPIADAR